MNCSSFRRWLRSHWSLPRFFKALNSFNDFRLMCIMYIHSNARTIRTCVWQGEGAAANRSEILFFLSLPPPWQLLSDLIAHALAVRALHLGRAWCGRPYIRKFAEGDLICRGSTPSRLCYVDSFRCGRAEWHCLFLWDICQVGAESCVVPTCFVLRFHFPLVQMFADSAHL